MMKLKFILLTSLLSFACSCFKSAEKNKAETLSSVSLKTISKKALESSSFAMNNERQEKWWKIFNNEELNALMEKAIKNSPSLKLAAAKIVTAQASAKSIRSKLFPNLSASATDNWVYLSRYGFDRDFFPLGDGDNLIPAKLNETDLSLNFNYEFDFWGKNRKMLKNALGIAIAEQMEKYQAELVLCEAVAYSYFEWQEHSAEKAIYEKWLEAQESLCHFFSSRYEKGLDNTLLPLEQNQALGALKQKILELENKKEVDLFFLKNLIGEGPDSPLSLHIRPEILLQKIEIPNPLGIDLLAQRPDLMAQIWRVSAAGDAIGVAKTEFYPNVNLAAFAGLSSLTFNHLFNWASRTGALNPAINLPLFTGGALTANLNRKISLFNEAVHSYNEQLLKAAEQVAQEITTFISLEDQIAIQQSLVDFQKKSYAVSTLRYKNGVDDYKNTLKSSLILFSQEAALIQLKHAQILSTLRIIQSLGGGMKPKQLPPSVNP